MHHDSPFLAIQPHEHHMSPPGVLQHHFDLSLLAPGITPSGSAWADSWDAAGHCELQRIYEAR